jgi:cytochrome c553
MTESNRIFAMKRVCAPLLIAMTLFASSAFAEGDIEAGKAATLKLCVQCHGNDGNASADGQYPRLAGQYEDYIARALHEYKTDDRKNPIMKGFASNLSDADIENIAAYYASLPDGKLTDLHGHIEGE